MYLVIVLFFLKWLEVEGLEPSYDTLVELTHPLS
jgi:hypothetical protein